MKIDLTEAEVKKLISLLGEKPYKDVFLLITKFSVCLQKNNDIPMAKPAKE